MSEESSTGDGPVAAGLGFLGGVCWAVYPTGLALFFRGAAPGQPPYDPVTAVYAQLLALPMALVLVGVPAVRRLPGADDPWGRRGIGLLSAGATLLAVGVLAVTNLSVPGQSPASLAAVPTAGLLLLQFGGTALGAALWTVDGDGDPTDADRSEDGEDTGTTPGFETQRRVAAGLLVLSVPATLGGIAASEALYSALPFYAGAAVPVGLGWAGACFAVLIATRGDGE